MSLVLIEGIDRTGKSSVAKYFESKGFQLVHLSAPKDTSPDAYLSEMVDLLTSAAAKDVVLDRTHYGELIWPKIYNRQALLSDDDIVMLREIEDQVQTKRILMTDPQVDAHWKRCVDNNEPLNKQQFVKVRTLYSAMAHKYGFELVSLPMFLKEFPDANEITLLSSPGDTQPAGEQLLGNSGAEAVSTSVGPQVGVRGLTAEQLKLERANAINEILSKRLLKQKGEAFDSLENELRGFLNTKLGQLLGGGNEVAQLTKEEVVFYKTMYKNATKKER
jgi:hypothetical protein